MDNCKVSVIMPIYNKERFIEHTLESVLMQSLPNIEVICTDDGSTDHSLQILQEFAKTDTRVKVFSQENQGPGSARNNCLKHAQGKYVVFLDGDDFYPDNSTLEKMFECIEQAQAKIAGGYILFFRDGILSPENPNPMYELIEKYPIGQMVDYKELQFDFNFTAYIYNREFLLDNNIWFPNYRRFEDPPFFVEAMVKAQSFYFMPFPTYVYSCGHQNINWTEETMFGMISGLKDNLIISRENQLQKLHNETFLRISHRYQKFFMPQLNKNNLKMICLLIQTWNEIDFSLVLNNKRDDDFLLINRAKIVAADYLNEKIINGAAMEKALEMLKKEFQQNGLIQEEILSRTISECELYWKRIYCPFENKPEQTVKVSVIIPVYNAEDYLESCLNSLIRQTEENFEVICIDDGSKDRSAEILKQYAVKDVRIKAIFHENQGAGPSRNLGISMATGRYLFFMDADDIAADTLLEKTYNAGILRNADVVAFDIYTFDANTHKTEPQKYCFRKQNAPVGHEVFSVKDTPNTIFQISNPSPWTKLVRREFVIENNIQYQNLQNTNDAYFAHICMALAERITLVDERLYFYRVGMEHNIQSNKEKNPHCIVEAFMAIYYRLTEKGIFKLCEKSWIKEFLSVICFTLNSVNTLSAYQMLYNRLMQPDVTETCLLSHEEGYYSDVDHYPYVIKFLKSPLKFSSQERRNTHYVVKGEQESIPDVSVIISVYNLEQYISECVESICNQSLKNIEIICIDDGSTDNSLNILEEIAKSDSRISVLTQKNSGLSAVRNEGLKIARGRYIHFMDGDDCLEPGAMEDLVQIMDWNSLDMAFFEGTTVFEDHSMQEKFHEYTNYYTYKNKYEGTESGLDLMARLTNNYEFKPSACMQISRTGFLRSNNILFYEGIIHEDELYTLHVLVKAQRCTVVREKYYLRKMRKGSIMTAPSSVASVLGYLVAYTESMKLVQCETMNIKYCKAIQARQKVFVNMIWKLYEKLTQNEKNWFHVFCSYEQKCVFETLDYFFRQCASIPKTTSVETSANKRLNDHDTALRYAQEELENARIRLNDHDTALRYAQMEIAELRSAAQNSISRKISRIVLWLPRKIKRFLQRATFASAKE